MLIIGLTGPSGSGKSVVATAFARYGLPVVDADKVYHDLLVPPSALLKKITDRFGEQILREDGTLNRKALGEIVFHDPASLQDLNTITHKIIMKEAVKRFQKLRKSNFPAAVFDAPQLFEAGGERICGAVVSVLADRDLRIQRLQRRDGLDEMAVIRRLNAQHSDEFFRTHSDFVIENNGSQENLDQRVREILVAVGVPLCD